MKSKVKILFSFLRFFFFVFILSSFLTSNSFSQNGKGQMILLKKRIERQEKNLKVLNNSLVQLERDLGKGHDRYIRVIEKRQNLEKLLENSKTLAYEEKVLLDEQARKTKKAFGSVLTSQIGRESGPVSDLMTHRILIKSFEKNLKELKALEDRNKVIAERIEEISQSYTEYLQVEEEIALFLKELEEEKKSKEIDYLNSGKKGVILKGQYESIQRKALKKEKVTYKNVSLRFALPLKVYDSIVAKQKKGVFVAKKKLGGHEENGFFDVYATQAGKIVYASDLSDFGNLVMIDHGSDIRSVILGTYDILVQNGDLVDKESKIGRIEGKNVSEGIYFEVRVKNIIKETRPLLENTP